MVGRWASPPFGAGGERAGAAPYGDVRGIFYRGELVAVTTRARVFLVPPLAGLEAGDPRLRFVAVMCLYSRDVDTREVPGPYDDGLAELYARCVLIPDGEFRCLAAKPDERLAARFRVPVEQIVAKRRDLLLHGLDDEARPPRA